MTGEPCEGGCGCRLGYAPSFEATFEILDVEAPEPFDGAAHTPDRCRLIRHLREAVEEAVPHGAVTVRSTQSNGLAVFAEVTVARTTTTAGSVLSPATITYLNPGATDAMIEAVVANILRMLAKPEEFLGGGVGGIGPVIARNPYAVARLGAR